MRVTTAPRRGILAREQSPKSALNSNSDPGLLSADTKRMEVGLPVVITLPKELGLFLANSWTSPSSERSRLHGRTTTPAGEGWR